VGNTLGRAPKGVTAAVLGRQGGALTSKRSLPALLPDDLPEEGQKSAALSLAEKGDLPFDSDCLAPIDLEFVATTTMEYSGNLLDFRHRCMSALRELSERLLPVSAHLKKFQPPSVQSVAKDIHVALIAVLTYIMGWPDVFLAQRFVTGFALVGVQERPGIFEEKEVSPPVPLEDLLRESHRLLASVHAERPSDEAEFLWESCLKEEKSGWAGNLMSEAQTDAIFGKGAWLPIPCFCVVQGTKRRRVDNAKKLGHNSTMAAAECLHMCSALQPAIAAKTLQKAADSLGHPWGLRLQSAGEDLPNAYRSLPVRPEDLRANIVAVRKPACKTMYFQSCYALLFGWSSSVSGFSRWSYFLEAASRRILALISAMYVDDANLLDLQSGLGVGQDAFVLLLRLLGTPAADEKRQALAEEGEFLGLRHDLRRCGDLAPAIEFWPREKLIQKALILIDEATDQNIVTPGPASKLRGMLGFLSTAMWHGVGTAATGALKQRQYSDREPWSLSNSLRRSLDYLRVVLSQQPRRLVELRPHTGPCILIASDARAGEGWYPSGGYLLSDPLTRRKTGGYCMFSRSLLEFWGYPQHVLSGKGNPIAICEGSMLPLTVLQELETLRNRRVLWFVDNTTALFSFIKGRASSAHLDRAISLTKFLQARFNITIWLEFTKSGGNWSDGISRLLDRDPFAARHGFETGPIEVWGVFLPRA
jgi:hypothetical protein